MLATNSNTANDNITPTATESRFARTDRIQHQAKATGQANNKRNGITLAGSIGGTTHNELDRPSKYGMTNAETKEIKAMKIQTAGILVLAHCVILLRPNIQVDRGACSLSRFMN